MKKLIVNADDLGLSPGVNRAILQGVAQGGITAASLMVNIPFAEDAAAQVGATCPDLSVALHFCLTSGQAILPQQAIPALVDAGGYFKFGFMGLWRGLASRKTRTDVLAQATAELNAQLHRVERLATQYSLRFDHLDSHQHIHVLPGLLELFEREAEKRRLILRVPHEPFGDCRRVLRRFTSWFPGGLARKAILDYHLYRYNLRYHLRRSRRDRPAFCDNPGIRTEQQVGYFGILDTGQAGQAAFREIVRVIRDDQSGCEIFELNIHPACCEDEHREEVQDGGVSFSKGDAEFQRSPWRRREWELVNSPGFHKLLADNGIALVSFAACEMQSR